MADQESDMEYSSDNDYEFEDYYNSGEDCDIEQIDPKRTDPEYFVYECLDVEEVEKLLNESVEKLSTQLQITPSLAKVLLHANGWNTAEVIERYRNNASFLLVSARIKPPAVPVVVATAAAVPAVTAPLTAVPSTSSGTGVVVPGYRTQLCPVCVTVQSIDKFHRLSCQHAFCRDCWAMHFEIQIGQGISTQIECMEQRCDVRVPEDLVLTLLNRPMLRDKYQQFAFADYVKSHPELRFCPGPNCQIIIRSQDICPKKALCRVCKTAFCFRCGTDYHAPTDCQIIRKWLTKCADDSETANYISAHTKDCPKCHICIEKNGGCNHMQCFNCKHDFCWMCLGDWKAHGSEYYECSRYKENPNIAHESVHAQAREALKKYLHYYERWENHSKSLQLEQQTLDRMKARINEKVMKGLGTWIDWQHLFDAAALLAKCRYTLQYTYPYAYYMDSRKELFEYQQAQLEAEIENLSWKVERAETTDRGELENQMDIAEKRRTTLLKDFFPADS
ncbi:potential E3 ubiquitin-protein ligase ariadne-2 [Anopheles ziemanni]|uniref:potential E3 ubiquitin-protein ligase ariadne-2 n=1 Tax=Anopheles ziemanni TaxID=345580 RepID=UPI002658E360|nr:potential E3 ubiquitin-protein ligase ariadne-2 isoform X3 [Anopheles coustani]XP_058168755.1 potential E3 ubiquitin-protein ligase ariadne-2 [Anopheles ziemanni]